MHPLALAAGAAAECAGRQGRFWQYHDLLFADKSALQPANLEVSAQSLGLDTNAFGACLTGLGTETVKADSRWAQSSGLKVTPSFFVAIVQTDGTAKAVEGIEGARPVAQFSAALDRALRSVGKATGQ